jgi:hypothetical protein
MAAAAAGLGSGGSRTGSIVDCIILAEFDIDTGSTVRHQYPHPIPGHEACPFAEYMLPEGAHNREEDWTYMILNRDGPQADEEHWQLQPSAAGGRSDSPLPPGAGGEGGAGGGMLFGINHVRTKYDPSVRRGAIVKAMAIFSRYNFVEVVVYIISSLLTLV